MNQPATDSSNRPIAGTKQQNEDAKIDSPNVFSTSLDNSGLIVIKIPKAMRHRLIRTTRARTA